MLYLFTAHDTEPIISPTTVEPEDGYDCNDYNPCSPENAAEGKLYFPNKDPTKFVQCSEHRQCYIMPCSSGLIWDAAANICNYPTIPTSTTSALSTTSATSAIPTTSTTAVLQRTTSTATGTEGTTTTGKYLSQSRAA